MKLFTNLKAVGISLPICSNFRQVNFWSFTRIWLLWKCLEMLWVTWLLGETRLCTTKTCWRAGDGSVRDVKVMLTDPTGPCSCWLQPGPAGRFVGWCSHLREAEPRCRNVVTRGWCWRRTLLELVCSAALWLWVGEVREPASGVLLRSGTPEPSLVWGARWLHSLCLHLIPNPTDVEF